MLLSEPIPPVSIQVPSVWGLDSSVAALARDLACVSACPEAGPCGAGAGSFSCICFFLSPYTGGGPEGQGRGAV